MSVAAIRKKSNSHGVAKALCALLFSVWPHSLFAETFSTNLPTATSQAQTPTAKKSILSDFELLIINRFWLEPKSQNNYLSNEVFLSYNINSNFSLVAYTEYDQATSNENAASSDFLDTDLRLMYKYVPSQKTWDAGGGLLGSFPTSRSSQEQSEYAGAGLKVFADLMTKPFTFSISSRFYEYFYQDSYIVSTNQGVQKAEPDNQSPDIPPTFNTTPLTPDEPKLIANCNSYSDSTLVVLYNLTSNFMLRNEVRYESYGYLDNHYSSLFHDKYGAGYNFAPEFTLWVSEDAMKNTDAPGAIFDSKYTTTIVSFYWKI